MDDTFLVRFVSRGAFEVPCAVEMPPRAGWVGMLLDNEDGSPELSVEGELQGRHVLVTISAKPFDDAEVESVIRG